MKEKLDNVLKRIFSFFLIVAILGGGIIFIMFLVALIIGGDLGASIAVSARETIMPYLIRSASISVLVGLISLYITGKHVLSL